MKIQTSRQFLARLANRRTARLMAAGAGLSSLLLAAAPDSARAATLFWDNDGATTTATGGTGTWNLTGSQWRNGSSTGTLQAWSDTTGTADIADFAGTAGTVTLGTNLGALGLIFDTTAYTVATSTFTLTLGTSGITQNVAAATISGILSLAGSQSWTVASGGTLTVSATVANNNTLTLAGAGNEAISGAISGTGGLVMSGTGTLTLSGTNTFSGGVTLNSGTLAITTGAGLGAAPTSPAVQLTFAGNSTFAIGNNALVANRNIQINSGVTGTIDTGTANTVSGVAGVISGAGNLVKINTSPLALTGTNTYSGSTTLGTTGSLANGGIVTVSGAAGSVASSSGVTINGIGSQFLLENSALTATATTDRVGNAAPVALNYGGEFRFNNSNTASVSISETFGTLALGSGAGIVTLSNGGSTSTGALTASGFSRGSNFATGLIRGTALGLTSATANTRVFLTDTSGLTLVGTATTNAGVDTGTVTNVKIVPYLLGATSGSSTGSEFVTYESTYGFRRLGTSEQSLVTAGAAGDNTRAAAGANAITGAKVFNSLLLNGGGTSATPAAAASTVTGDGNSFTLTSGALANVATGAAGTGSLSGFSSIIFGTTGANEAVITNTNASGALTISSPINTFAAGGGLTTAGAGTVILGAANLYTGQTTVNAGTLQIGTGTAGSLAGSGSSGAIVMNGGNLSFGRTDAGLNLANNITGLGSVTQAGTGTTTLSGTNTYTGVTTVSAGTLQAGAATSAFGSNSAVTIANVAGATLALNGFNQTIGSLTGGGTTGGSVTLGNGGILTTGGDNTATTFAGAVSGTGGLVKNGTGNMTLSGVLSQTGGITVNSSFVTLTGNNTFTGQNIIASGGAIGLNSSSSANALGASGVGNETVIQNGGYLRYQDGTNTIPESFIINGTGAGNGAVQGYNNSVTFSGSVQLAGSSVLSTRPNSANKTVTFSGVVSDQTAGANNNLAIYRVNNVNATSLDAVTLTNASTYGGNTYVVDGFGTTSASQFALNLQGGDNRLPTTTVLTLGGTTSAINGNAIGNSGGGARLVLGTGAVAVNQTLAGLTTGSTSSYNAVVGGSTALSTLTINNTANYTFGGIIGATTLGGTAATNGTNLALVKNGAGTFTISGTNGYTGGTTVNAGQLTVGNASALGAATGALTVSGGTLDLTTFSPTIGAVTLSSGTIQSTGSTTAALTGTSYALTNTGTVSAVLAGTGALTKTGAGTATLTGANTYTGATTINQGTLDLGGSTATGSIAATSALAMGGGTLNYTRTGTNSQTFNGTTFNSGGSTITVAAGNTLNLGAITRNTGATVFMNTTGTITTSTANRDSNTNPANTNGFLGAYAVYGGYDWASNNGSAITYFSGYTTYNNVASVPAGVDLTDNGNGYDGSSTGGATNVNSVRFNEGNADSTINLGGNLTVNSGGILVTPNLGQKYARINGSGLTTTSPDLVIQQQNTSTGHLQIGSSIYGAIGLTKAGPGQLDLNGFDATYTGITTVNGGTMLLTSATTATSAVVVNNSGTVLLGANDRINDAATVTLNGGTINTGGFQEGRATGTAAATQGLGALTLSTSSFLDFGAGHSGSSVLAFAPSNTQTWSGTLTLSDFTPGTDFLNFGSGTGLTATQLSEIFYTNGTNTFGATGLDSFGDVLFSATPVPEPSTWLAGFLMLGTLGYSQRRRVRRWMGLARLMRAA